MEATVLVLLAALATPTSQDATPPEPEEESQKHQREGVDDEDIDVSSDDVDRDAELPEETVEFYGSARFVVGSDGNGLQARDNLSRAGLFAAKDIANGYNVYARLELGVNLVDAFGRLLNPKASGPEGSNGVVPRLGYLGIETPFGRGA